MRFEQPWVLLLLAALPLLIWWRLWRRPGAALLFSSAEPVSSLRPTMRTRLARLPFWMRVAALCLLIVALARPQTGGERTREVGRGIAIYMAIDRSGSMDSPITYGGTQTTRISLAKQFLLEFVAGNGGALNGRGSDQIGIVSFARQPETVCPLTFAHDSFAGLLAGIRTPADRDPDNATAIGDAVSLAAARLKNTAAGDLKSKVIILLTDGENTAGVRSVVEGAQLAARWGIRVHAIGIVGPAPASANSAIYRYGVQQRFAAERDLNQLAGMCGGIYRSAQDGEALKSVYAEIDRLEKSELARTRFIGGADQFGLLTVWAFALLMGAWVLSNTWLRRIP
jgi:Ca-activated chloride channel family protein